MSKNVYSTFFQGDFKKSLPDPSGVVGCTKWCVFRQTTPSREVVEAAIKERLSRMQGTSVDLLQVRAFELQSRASRRSESSCQFHWQDYSDKGYLQALSHLRDMRREGLIKAIGLCNFDTIRTDEICTQLGPGSTVSNQVQVSEASRTSVFPCRIS